MVILGADSLSLPDDMSQWNQLSTYKIHARWWNEADLQPAIRNLGSMHAFFDKLNSGKAIVGVGFGSSFVHDFAGCFDTGPERFEELGIVPNPFTYPQPGQNWTATIELMNRQNNNKCEDGGYMQAVFHTLNLTWPNPKHIFLNNAKGGASLDSIVDASCSSTITPDDVDLVFLDPATASSSHQSVEKLIRKYSKSKSKPVIVMVSNSRQCDLELKSGVDPEICPSGCLSKLNKSACALLDEDPYPPSEKINEAAALRDHYQSIALHYNVTHLDLFTLMRNWTHSSEILTKSKSKSKYELVSKMYMDWVHFQKCYGYRGGKLFEMENHARSQQQPASNNAWKEADHFRCDSNVTGAFVLADLLVLWLKTMQKRLDSVPTIPIDQPLPSALNDKVDEIFESRCYGFSFASFTTTAMDSKGPGDEAAKEAFEQLKHVAPGDFYGGQIGDKAQGFGRPGGFHPLPPLNVTRSEGWSLQAFYKGTHGVKFKPGFVTDKAGSVLEFLVDSDLASSSTSLGRDPEVLISYTSSWDGWGSAKVSCVEGCSCFSTSIDSMSHVRHSLLKSLVISVSSHKMCKIRIEATGPSGSRNAVATPGSKLKISSVLVRLAVKA